MLSEDIPELNFDEEYETPDFDVCVICNDETIDHLKQEPAKSQMKLR